MVIVWLLALTWVVIGPLVGYVPEEAPTCSWQRTATLVLKLMFTPVICGLTTRLVTVVAKVVTCGGASAAAAAGGASGVVITHHHRPSAGPRQRRICCPRWLAVGLRDSAWQTRSERSHEGQPCPAASGCTG